MHYTGVHAKGLAIHGNGHRFVGLDPEGSYPGKLSWMILYTSGPVTGSFTTVCSIMYFSL